MNSESTKTTLLRRARIVLPERVIEDASLLIRDGRIARISGSQSSETLRADSELDLNGLTLWSGFIDVHIHGSAGVDTMNAGAEDLGRVSRFLARHGVTGWLPTLVPSTAAEYENAIAAIEKTMRQQRTENERGGGLSSRVLGVHYEGPFVNTAQCGALHREHFRSFKSLNELDTLPTINDHNAIQMMTLAPEIDGGIELIRELGKRGWIVSIGHTRAGAGVLDQAFQAGARHLTHFMNAMTSLHHRAPGPVGWGLDNDEVTCDLIADGIHIDPMILRVIIRCKTSGRISLISDAIAAAGLGDGEFQIWGETISVENRRTSNARGSIAGSVITVLDALCTMLSLGMAESDVARMASLNPARLLGIGDDFGSIEAGKRADLVALDQDRNVRLTIIGGCVAFNSLA